MSINKLTSLERLDDIVGFKKGKTGFYPVQILSSKHHVWPIMQCYVLDWPVVTLDSFRMANYGGDMID